MSFQTISVIGLGYIGLPTAAMFASCKKNVIGVDINKNAVDTINRGEIHIVEPELDVLVKNAVQNGYLRAVLVPEPADAFLIAVPTPFKPCKDGDIPEPDLKYIEAAVRAIAKVLKKGDLVILESTSPVGTTEKMAEWLSEIRPDLNFAKNEGDNTDIYIAHCPERVLPGQVVRELVENDRVVGGVTKKCSELAVKLYKTFVRAECVVTNARTAEMAKLTENSCRDVQIAFANELSIICDQLNIDVWELISLANRHPRINILQPGPGVGGHCIAVDPWFIVSKSPDEARLIRTAREVNDDKPYWVINKVKEAVTNYLIKNPELELKDISIACYGLAFKSDIDDLRESPAVLIVNCLIDYYKNNIVVIEPHISNEDLIHYKENHINDWVKAKEADIHVILVDHTVLKNTVFDKLKAADNVIDCRGVIS